MSNFTKKQDFKHAWRVKSRINNPTVYFLSNILCCLPGLPIRPIRGFCFGMIEIPTSLPYKSLVIYSVFDSAQFKMFRGRFMSLIWLNIKNDLLGRSRLDQKALPEIKDISTSRYPRWEEGSWHFDKKTKVILCGILCSLKMSWEDFRGVLYYESQPGARLTCSSGFLLAFVSPPLRYLYPFIPLSLPVPKLQFVWTVHDVLMYDVLYDAFKKYIDRIDDIMELIMICIYRNQLHVYV